MPKLILGSLTLAIAIVIGGRSPAWTQPGPSATPYDASSAPVTAISGGHGPLVFCQDDGRPLNWENIVRRDFRRVMKRMKLPIIRPYEFDRHAHAAWLYEQGVHPTIISQRLGHSSTAFTMDTYGYLDRGLQAPVVAKLQAWLSENAPR